ncbi:hypothetical protein ACWEPB_02610 [Kitasatospora cineracea]
MTRRQQRDRIAAALDQLDPHTRHTLGLNTGGQRARSTYAGLLADAFAPELARGREAEATVARIRNTVRRLPAGGTVPVRTILDALYGEDRP